MVVGGCSHLQSHHWHYRPVCVPCCGMERLYNLSCILLASSIPIYELVKEYF